MWTRGYFSTFLYLMLFLPLAPVDGSADDKLHVHIDKVIHRMEKGGIAQVWTHCTELRELTFGMEEEALGSLLKGTQSASPVVRLGCAKTLIDIEEEKEAVPVLIRLAHDKSLDEVRLGAIGILGSLYYLEGRLDREVETALVKVLDDERDPVLLVETAKALYQVSDHQYRLTSKARLKEMLDSDIRSIRVNAALALAEIGDLESSRAVLQEIKDDPSYSGRMAKVLLKARNWETYLLKALNEKHLDIPDGNSLSPSSSGLELISELINIVQDKHIRGDQFKDKEGVEKLLTAAAKGMLNYLDPHSTYFSQREYERWIMDLERKYAGIGAYVNTIDGVFTIVRPIYSGPAYKVGLRTGDQIWKVDGWETFNETNDEIIRRLKGLPGSEVVITIYRPGWKEERNFRVIRQEINIPSVNAELYPGGIAYTEVSQFAAGTGKELAAKIRDFRNRGATSLILDLRNNSGGYLNEAVNVCSLFLAANKLAVYTEGRQTPRRNYYTRDLGISWEGPLVCMVNRRSASASEIVSGALQHYSRAYVVGEKSYGKGSVQNPLRLTSRRPELFDDSNSNGIYDQGEDFKDLNNNGKYDVGPMMKITSAMYYLPSGRSIHKLRDEEGSVINEGGVTPDLGVKYEGIDPWKEEELADLVEKKAFRDYVDKWYDTKKEKFRELAEGDNFETDRYPEFETYFKSLETHLSRQDIRKWIRLEVRRKVQDDRSPPRPFPGFGFFGDYQEDSQLQAAILEALKRSERNAHDIMAYTYFADKKFEVPTNMETKEAAKTDEPPTPKPAEKKKDNKEGGT